MMELTVRVANKHIRKGHCTTFECGDYIVKPFKITRRACGHNGAARNRYYYVAHFIGFGDMLDCHNKSLAGVATHENVVRSSNKKFNPKKLNWIGNIAMIS